MNRKVLVSLAVIVMLFVGGHAVAQQRVAGAAPSGTCQGILRVEGKSYKLAFLAVYPTLVFDEPGYEVLLSSKPIPIEKLKQAHKKGNGKPEGFFFWEPHVTVTFKPSGEVMFCNAYAENTSFGVSGSKLTGALTIKDGRARGNTALKQDDDSKRKESFEATFDVTLLDVPAARPVDVEKPSTEKPAEESREQPTEADETPEPKKEVNIRDLAIPKGATDVRRKDLVEQMGFNAPGDVRKTVAAFSQSLAKQGWTKSGSDLVTPKSAIMHRTKGVASLTIFVKPNGAGSKVNLMSDGLDWSEPAETE